MDLARATPGSEHAGEQVHTTVGARCGEREKASRSMRAADWLPLGAGDAVAICGAIAGAVARYSRHKSTRTGAVTGSIQKDRAIELEIWNSGRLLLYHYVWMANYGIAEMEPAHGDGVPFPRDIYAL